MEPLAKADQPFGHGDNAGGIICSLFAPHGAAHGCLHGLLGQCLQRRLCPCCMEG